MGNRRLIMKHLQELTQEDCIELGNMAYRVVFPKPKKTDLYKSDKWKLHLFLDKEDKCRYVAIVDEITPLKHIDDLYTKDNSNVWCSSDPPFRPYPLFNHIVLRYEYLNGKDIRMGIIIDIVCASSIEKVLDERSQEPMFDYLGRKGFLGDEIVLE